MHKKDKTHILGPFFPGLLFHVSKRCWLVVELFGLRGLHPIPLDRNAAINLNKHTSLCCLADMGAAFPCMGSAGVLHHNETRHAMDGRTVKRNDEEDDVVVDGR